MASLPVNMPVYLQEDTWDRYRPPDPKTTRSPKAKSFSLKHKTRSPADAVKESEQSLNQLLEDFEEGRLNAFGMIAFDAVFIVHAPRPVVFLTVFLT